MKIQETEYKEFYDEHKSKLPVLYYSPHFFEKAGENIRVANYSQSEEHNSSMYNSYNHFTAISKTVNYE